MNFVLYLLAVLASVVVLVMVHELGHFLIARLVGVKATEFFVGFGPRLWSFRRGDTEYGIKWILVGGYVKILGMNPDEEVDPEDWPHSYRGVPHWKRLCIVLAGSLFHVILALVLAFSAIYLLGVPNPDRPSTVIAEVGRYMEDGVEETPAWKAGLKEGDRILAVDGREVSDWWEMRDYIRLNPGREVLLTVKRGRETLDIPVVLAVREDGSGYLGVSPLEEKDRYGLGGALIQTGRWFLQASYGVFYGIYRMFSWSTFKQLLGISEPTAERPVTVVGASRLAGRVAAYGAFYFLNFLGFILLFLAYVNLLPLPPLDGGHLLVILVEKVSGREVDLRKLYPVAVVVIAFFVTMFVLTLRLDIFSPIQLP
jgi:membrane-associated protease RseP (regulator of RpoE activity)